MTTPQPPYGSQPPPPPPSVPTGFGPPLPPEPPAPLPEFLAIDKHNSVAVDASGVAFEPYGLPVEFAQVDVHAV